jgi:hypothetical protein
LKITSVHGSHSRFDLPPTQRAQPLSVGKFQNAKTENSKRRSSGNYASDDTPKMFARLLAFSKTGKGLQRGLDNGETGHRGMKRKRGNDSTDMKQNPSLAAGDDTGNDESFKKPLQIQPGERLADFARRVNQALPLSGLNTKGKKVEGIKERETKHEKKLRRMQAEWREEEKRIREKEEEERELAEERLDEALTGLDKESRQIIMSAGKIGGKKKRKEKSKTIGEIEEDDGDPWDVLKHKRQTPLGIFDVVQAPPRFDKVPREILKGTQVHDVPKEAGSLRRREDLGQTRAQVIKSYRAMMAARRT